MQRLGKSLATDSEILSLERVIAEIEAVERDERERSSPPTCSPPDRLSVAAIGPNEARLLAAARDRHARRSRSPREQSGRPERILLNGARGKVGAVLGPALEAGGHRARRERDAGGRDGRLHHPRRRRRQRPRARSPPGSLVVGTSGWEPAEVERSALAAGLAVFYAPNFALGAVLMMRFARRPQRAFRAAEIIEFHHAREADAPSGTARATAERCGARCRSTRCGFPACSPTRR